MSSQGNEQLSLFNHSAFPHGEMEMANSTKLVLEAYKNTITAKVNIHRTSLERFPTILIIRGMPQLPK
jgi:hypothetical protein